MAIPDVKEKFSGKVNEVTIGATKEQGGTRSAVVTVGGETGLPMLGFEAEYPNPPAFALEINNAGADNWPEQVKKHVADVSEDLEKWAVKCEQWGADLICLRLEAGHPDLGGKSPQQCADDVKRVLGATGLPLIIWGTDDYKADNDILARCSHAAQGENCLIGTAKEKNYRTLAASALADSHKVIAEAPSDINLSKQLHILLGDVGVDLKNIVMHPTTGALGFGMIYIYTTIERGRVAALGGDALLQQPVIVDLGREIGRVKEATTPEGDAPQWGPLETRAVMWEAATVLGYLECGAELFVLRNPEALAPAREAVNNLWPK